MRETDRWWRVSHARARLARVTPMSNTAVLGIDIGGTGIKGAPVDLSKGDFATDRLRIPTPAVSTPEAVADVVAQAVAGRGDHGLRGHRYPVGDHVPAVGLAVGEGAAADTAGSHFQRFLSIRSELQALTRADPAFRAAYPAATNPVLRRPPG